MSNPKYKIGQTLTFTDVIKKRTELLRFGLAATDFQLTLISDPKWSYAWNDWIYDIGGCKTIRESDIDYLTRE